MKDNKELILNALKDVLYFPKGSDIISLNMVRNLEVDGHNISFTIVFPKQDDKSQPALQKLSEAAIRNQVDPEALVKITFVTDFPSLQAVKHIIAVGSGKGGVGKSTIAANLAVALSKLGLKVGILDADIYGPSIPIMFDVEDERPVMDPEAENGKIIPVEKYGIKVQSIGFFVDPQQALIWRGPMASNALNQLFNDTHWGELDYLVVDLPPGTGDIHLTLVQQYPVEGIAIVSTPQQVALADAKKAFSMFNQDKIRVRILGLIENMSYFTPAELPENKYYLFGKHGGRRLADDERVNLLAEIPLVQSICESGDTGSPVALDEQSPVYKAFMNLAINIRAIIEHNN
ncbi:MAG: Mrp/NBP35 family ATP-binding protein [Bacteroidales bacterium]|nr:Mrp/NBP35 family ATP-binding protein [Bacteroidales bacterium]